MSGDHLRDQPARMEKEDILAMQKAEALHKLRESPAQTYQVQVYVKHGFFEYDVDCIERAMAHGEAIMSNQTYRRFAPNGKVEFHHVYSVKVVGPDLESQYTDRFVRT